MFFNLCIVAALGILRWATIVCRNGRDLPYCTIASWLFLLIMWLYENFKFMQCLLWSQQAFYLLLIVNMASLSKCHESRGAVWETMHRQTLSLKLWGVNASSFLNGRVIERARLADRQWRSIFATGRGLLEETAAAPIQDCLGIHPCIS